jgi:hypothetical protein
VGHIKSTLRKLDVPIPGWLQHVEQAPSRSVIRREKDKFAREILKEKENISALFGEAERQSLSTPASKSGPEVVNDTAQNVRKRISDGLRMYRILQPDALPFYKQDAMLSMKTKLNQLENQYSNSSSTLIPADAPSLGDPFQLQLPVVNPRSFMLALEAATRSLADDLESICVEILGVEEVALPEKNDPERFLLLVKQVFNAFPLRKDPSHVDQFMVDSWPRLKRLLPESFDLPDQEVADWLRGHLERVLINQRGSSLTRNEWYNLAVDFSYDNYLNPRSVGGKPMPDISKVKDQTSRILRALGFGDEGTVETVSSQLQQFVYDCDKIGLKRWLQEKEIDRTFDEHLPRGPVPVLAEGEAKPEDIETARLMLKCAARGKPNLLDFDALSPSKLLHSFPTESVEDELSKFPENDFLPDSEIDQLIDVELAAQTLRERPPGKNNETSSPLEELVQSEIDFAKTAGPADWDNGDWKWKRPSEALFDSRLGKYVRNQSLVDPNLNLSSFRQYTCDVRRMCSMSSAGRVYYARSIVVVGNGQGIYGFGVGFGNTPRESNADAAVKALRNLRYVDYDPTRTLTTPVR